MLTLLLLRHAKSSWTQIGATDFERPLNERGRTAAPLIGRYIQNQENLVPQRIYCSAAARAQITAQLVLAEIPNAPEPVYERALYDGGTETSFHFITGTENGVSPVMVVGHNPTIHALALSLSGTGNPDALEKLRYKYPTGGLAVIDFELSDWRDIGGGDGYLREFISPRELESVT